MWQFLNQIIGMMKSHPFKNKYINRNVTLFFFSDILIKPKHIFQLHKHLSPITNCLLFWSILPQPTPLITCFKLSWMSSFKARFPLGKGRANYTAWNFSSLIRSEYLELLRYEIRLTFPPAYLNNTLMHVSVSETDLQAGILNVFLLNAAKQW